MSRRPLLFALALLCALPAVDAQASSGGGEEKKKGGGATFIQIQTMTANMRRANGRMGVMTVETGLDVKDDKLRTLASQSQPRLRAAYAQFLTTYAASLRPGAAPSADHVARELQRQTDLVLGRPGAKLLVGTILLN